MLSFRAMVCVASFTVGMWWKRHYGASSRVVRRPEVQVISLTVEGGKGQPIFGGSVMFSLDSYPDGEDQRLCFKPIVGWSESPNGPFLEESGYCGPVYRSGSMSFIKLVNGEVWSVGVLDVHPSSIDAELRGPINEDEI